jgi:hypothetical protein
MLEDYTKHQQKIIKGYYRNLDAIVLQKLAEWVTELYLAEGKKRQKLWQQVKASLEKIEFPQSRIDHLLAKDNPALLAEVVKELHSAK